MSWHVHCIITNILNNDTVKIENCLVSVSFPRIVCDNSLNVSQFKSFKPFTISSAICDFRILLKFHHTDFK